ncbi:MAG: hypothetical protein M4D80_35395 [Myxococcota bacterium]|nr:hypothetical protein [Myxococcota bacterium]
MLGQRQDAQITLDRFQVEIDTGVLVGKAAQRGQDAVVVVGLVREYECTLQGIDRLRVIASVAVEHAEVVERSTEIELVAMLDSYGERVLTKRKSLRVITRFGPSVCAIHFDERDLHAIAKCAEEIHRPREVLVGVRRDALVCKDLGELVQRPRHADLVLDPLLDLEYATSPTRS